jgi:crotonobetaine/carnitine-CoA ligase
VLRDAGARRAFARTDQAGSLREAGLPGDIELIEVAGPGAAPAAWDRAVAAVPAQEPPAAGLPLARDVATVIYTSGTTGPAKGVLVTWGQIANAVGLRPRRLLRPADAYFVPWPPFHVMGLTPLAIMSDVGGRVVLRNGPSISSFWRDVDENGCTCATIGPIARLLMDHPPRPDDGGHALRSVVMGPVIPDVDAFRERFGVGVMTVYGSSEIAYPLVSRHVDGTNRHLAGKLRPGYAARVVDAALHDVPDGSVGELLIRTGDAFVRHPDGWFEFVDRMRDTIRRFGENVSSAFLESVIMKEDGVLECAAVGVPSAATGEEIHLAVVPAAGVTLDPEAFSARLRAVLPRHMVPAHVSIGERLPKTPNGKIRKVDLRRAGGRVVGAG